MGLRHGRPASEASPPVSSQLATTVGVKCELTRRRRRSLCLSPHPRPSRPRPQPARAVAETAAVPSVSGVSFPRPGDLGINHLAAPPGAADRVYDSVMTPRPSLLRRDRTFFDLFIEAGASSVHSAQLLVDLIERWPDAGDLPAQGGAAEHA